MSDDQFNVHNEQYVSFVLGKEYGIPILSVHEIIRYKTLTKIPQSAEFVDGVLNLRGQVIPVVNLRKKFGLQECEDNKSTRIIVVDVGSRITGIVVDEVSEVIQVGADNISPPPPMGTTVDTDFISGMGKLENSLIILLDINKVLTTDEKISMEEMATV